MSPSEVVTITPTKLRMQICRATLTSHFSFGSAPASGPLLALPLQAQTVANFFLAFEQELAIVPVLNKIDMESAEPKVCCVTVHAVPWHVRTACKPQTGLLACLLWQRNGG